MPSTPLPPTSLPLDGTPVAHVAHANVGLDVVRGVAALLVVLGHSREILYRAQDLPVTGTGWQRIALLPTSVAQESVAVFFVLSGYLVGGQVLRQFGRRHFEWPTYLVKRLSRLWVVLIPGLLLTVAADAGSVRLAPAVFERLTGRQGYFDLSSLGCNVAFLQRARCQTFGSNDSLWSLSYEFWFYVLFAAGVGLVWAVARRQLLGSAAYLGVFAAVLVLFGLKLLLLLPAWLLGAAMGRLHDRWRRQGGGGWSTSRWAVAAGVLALGAAMGASNLLAPSDPIRFLLVGLGAFPLLFVFAVRDPQPTSSLLQRAWHGCARLGPWSYSLYVFHLPLIVTAAVALHRQGSSNRVASTLVVYLLAAVTVACTYPLSQATERHTAPIRARLLRLVVRSPSHIPAGR